MMQPGHRARELRRALESFSPASSRASASRDTIANALDHLDDAFSDPFSHVTASAIVLSARGVLLHEHKRLGIWVGPGGHVDGIESPVEAAIRECVEETGIKAASPESGPALLDVDVHAGPKGHVHLDTRWLLIAPPDDPAPPEGESPNVHWLSPASAESRMPHDLRDALARALELYKLPQSAVHEQLRGLAFACGAWAVAVMTEDRSANVLRCHLSHNLPSGWKRFTNDLNGTSANARAFRSQDEVIDHDMDSTKDGHRITAVAAVPIPGFGTLQVLSNQENYRFTKERVARIWETASTIAPLL